MKSAEHLCDLVSEFEQEFAELPTQAIAKRARIESLKTILLLPILDCRLLALLISLALFAVPIFVPERYWFPSFLGLDLDAFQRLIDICKGIILMLASFAAVCVVVRLVCLFNFSKFDCGIPLDPKTSPEIFALVRRIAKETQNPIPKNIYITGGFDAFANYAHNSRWLSIRSPGSISFGILFLEQVSQIGFAGIVAHELAHLRKNNRHPFILLRALNALWGINHQSGFSRQHEWVEQRYRRLRAISILLSRRNEIAADQDAHAVAGELEDAIAHLRFNSIRLFLDDFEWFQRKACIEHKEPTEELSKILHSDLQKAFESDDFLRQGISDGKLLINGCLDTHPRLFDRANHAYEIFDSDPGRILTLARNNEPPASELLGERLDSLRQHFDKEYYEHNKSHWQGYREYFQRTSNHEEPNAEELAICLDKLALAKAQNDGHGIEKWSDLILSKHPRQQGALLVRSCFALRENDDPSAIETLMELAQDADCITHQEDAYNELYRHFAFSGDREKLDEVQRLYDKIEVRKSRIYCEQNSRPKFEAANLNTAQQQFCCDVFSEYEVIKAVYVARLLIPSSPGSRHLTFAVRFKFRKSSSKILNEIADRLILGQYATEVVNSKFNTARFAAIKKVKGSKIY